MSDIHLITAIAKKYATMSVAERVKKIRKLITGSEVNEKFIRKYYPEFYQEAFPTTTTSSSADANLESNQPQTLSAKTR